MREVVLPILIGVLIALFIINFVLAKEHLDNEPADEKYKVVLYEGYRVSDVKKTFSDSVKRKNFNRIIFPFNLKSYTIQVPKLTGKNKMLIKMMSLYDGSNIASSVATGVGSNPYKEPEYTRGASPTKYKILEELILDSSNTPVNKVVELTDINVKRIMLMVDVQPQ